MSYCNVLRVSCSYERRVLDVPTEFELKKYERPGNGHKKITAIVNISFDFRFKKIVMGIGSCA